jgi:acetyl-CoA carboxylase biotin carboxyl carrier protein
MMFTMDDIEQTLQILRHIKDVEEIELHIETGDMKLSVWKGKLGEGAGGAPGVSRESAVCLPQQPAQSAAPTAAVGEDEQARVQAAVGAQPAASEATGASAAVARDEEAIPEGLVAVRASVTSVFYRKPSPEEPNFVEVGSEVEEDTVLCLLEVMKCFRSVSAGVKGRVEKILAESGQLVEYGTVLFHIRPA